ncbi:MAG: hypothetical protein NC310_01510 [Roseburia sp.]|nr:hypothetical protein [Anaeroplasma bactoclasticum]MCM1195731.1 hypothetical protein [Roseburia sp.]MCM1556081.1 hypothetical protein [Anaeroplasma bactoclasticum]
MLGFVKKYRNLSFENRTIFHARFSILFNLILALGKVILGFLINTVFFVTAAINVFMMLSRFECYLGITKTHRKSFRYRNNFVGTFLLLAGVSYTIYMILLLFSIFEMKVYTMSEGTIIAFVSFIELGVAIKGCLNAYGKGHYYRNIKMISLCSALTAMSLTEMAIMSFANSTNTQVIDCWFGIGIGVLIIILGIYVFIAPMVSIIDRKHNVYKMTETSDLTEDRFKFKLTNSKFYGNYYYIGKIENKIVDGLVLQEKNPIFKWNVFVLILVIILSEILIFPYAIGAIIFHFKNAGLIKKLDKLMTSHSCIKLEEQEEA